LTLSNKKIPKKGIFHKILYLLKKIVAFWQIFTPPTKFDNQVMLALAYESMT
jgi:hypothetical protein